MLMTDPEIVEDAYAFDNPCFKDATPAAVSRVAERSSSAVPGDTPAKDSTRWSTPWTSLGLGSAVRNDKRRTLDDSCVGVSIAHFSSLLFLTTYIALLCSINYYINYNVGALSHIRYKLYIENLFLFAILFTKKKTSALLNEI